MYDRAIRSGFTPLHHMLKRHCCSVQNHDEGISLEACEFWSTFCDAVVEPELLRPFLQRLVPILLCNMVYEDFDEEVADAEAAEVADSAADRDADIKPFIHRCARGNHMVHSHVSMRRGGGGGGEEGLHFTC